MNWGLKPVHKRRDDALSRVRWDKLESLLAEHYRGEGFHVEHVGTGGRGRRFDGGIDLKLHRDDEYILVQSKHWNAFKVTHNAVNELLGIMVNEGASGAILVTSGEFTRAATEAAKRHGHVQLVDGDDLRQMLGSRLPTGSSDEGASPPSWMRLARAGADFARNVVERRSGRSWGGVTSGRTGADSPFWLLVAKDVVPFVLVLVLILFVSHFIQNVVKSGVVSPVSVPAVERAAPLPPPPAPSQPQSVPSAGAGSERVRTSPSAQIGSAEEMMSPEELAEWKRNNAASMRILEKTTPELGSSSRGPGAAPDQD